MTDDRNENDARDLSFEEKVHLVDDALGTKIAQQLNADIGSPELMEALKHNLGQEMYDKIMNTPQNTQKITTASAYRQRRQQGTEWTAPSGAVVLVRELDISDHAVANKLPGAIRQRVYDMIAQSASLRTGGSDDSDDNPFGGMSGEELLQVEAETGTVLCKLGWVNPQVVDEVEDPNTQISVDELDPRDRRAFMVRVFGGNHQEAQELAGFRRESAGDVRPVPAVQDVPGDAVRTTEAGEVRVLRSDGV